MKKKIKKALKHYIKRLKDENFEISFDKEAYYKKIKKELKKAATKYIEKKVAKKPLLKYGLKLIQGTDDSDDSDDSEDSDDSDDATSKKKSRVSFKLDDMEVPSDLNLQYARIKNELKKKIKSLHGKTQHSYPSVSQRDQSDDSELEDYAKTKRNSGAKSLRRSMTYYFLERNRNFDFYSPIPAEVEEISEVMISLEDLADPKNYIL